MWYSTSVLPPSPATSPKQILRLGPSSARSAGPSSKMYLGRMGPGGRARRWAATRSLWLRRANSSFRRVRRASMYSEDAEAGHLRKAGSGIGGDMTA